MASSTTAKCMRHRRGSRRCPLDRHPCWPEPVSRRKLDEVYSRVTVCSEDLDLRSPCRFRGARSGLVRGEAASTACEREGLLPTRPRTDCLCDTICRRIPRRWCEQSLDRQHQGGFSSRQSRPGCFRQRIGSFHQFIFVRYGRRNEVRSSAIAASSLSGCRTADGRLWFATVNGMVVLEAASLPVNRVAPTPILEQILCDGRGFERLGIAGTARGAPRNRVSLYGHVPPGR